MGENQSPLSKDKREGGYRKWEEKRGEERREKKMERRRERKGHQARKSLNMNFLVPNRGM